MMESWGRWALETSLIAGLMGILVLVGSRLLRPDPRPRSILLALGMVSFVLPPLVELPLSSLFFLRAAAESLDSLVSGSLSSGPLGRRLETPLAILAVAQWAGLAVGGGILARSALRLGRILGQGTRLRAGPAWEAVQSLAGRTGMPVPEVYLISGGTPAAAGVVRGAILLPRSSVDRLDPGGLPTILAHEMAHLARRDPLAAMLRHLLISLWWFHPVVWALAREHRAASEDACDDAALSTGHEDREAYCRTLVACAANARNPGSRAGSEPPASLTTPLGGHPLERRIRRILGDDRREAGSAAPSARGGWGPRASRGVGTALLGLALLMLPVRAVSWNVSTDRGETDRTERMVQKEEVIVRSTRVVAR